MLVVTVFVVAVVVVDVVVVVVVIAGVVVVVVEGTLLLDVVVATSGVASVAVVASHVWQSTCENTDSHCNASTALAAWLLDAAHEHTEQTSGRLTRKRSRK